MSRNDPGKRKVIVFPFGKRYHMPCLEQMPGCSVPMASRMTVCLSAIGLPMLEVWAQKQGLTPCRDARSRWRPA